MRSHINGMLLPNLVPGRYNYPRSALLLCDSISELTCTSLLSVYFHFNKLSVLSCASLTLEFFLMPRQETVHSCSGLSPSLDILVNLWYHKGWTNSPPKLSNLYKVLQLFHILRSWIDLHLINHSFWNKVYLTQPNVSPKHYGGT